VTARPAAMAVATVAAATAAADQLDDDDDDIDDGRDQGIVPHIDPSIRLEAFMSCRQTWCPRRQPSPLFPPRKKMVEDLVVGWIGCRGRWGTSFCSPFDSMVGVEKRGKISGSTILLKKVTQVRAYPYLA